MIDIDDFYKLPKDLTRADGFISNTTNEPVKLTTSAKIIYAYMISRNKFFTEDLNNKHFESQTTIAESCGLEYKATGKILREFVEHGLISAKKLRPEKGGQWRWFYEKVTLDVKLWVGTVKDFTLIDKEHKKKVESNKTQMLPRVKPVEPDWDESDLPF